ncbi:hypothetical protein GIB67_042763 [Kingdonia uniflora]|uniref:Uncharacterized protein n=1 Tax=Kingdonia uniflora TaxID=39325 RepID=A0A7J7L124_9MAGN|nr:hypothetical protein GIB67_042763 [Kingdonia uniflora]
MNGDMHIFENVDEDHFYYQGLLEYIMSDVIGINKAISPGSRIVVKILCTVPIEVVPSPLIQQLDIVMMELDKGPPICPTSQVEVKVETTQFDPMQHKSTQFDPLQHETIARENTKRLKKPRASEVPEEELDDLPHMDFSDDEPNIETEGEVGLREDALVNAETKARLGREAPANDETGAGVGLGGEASYDEEEVDAWNRWAETNPDSLDAEEGYYSNHSSVDGDDGPTQADIDKCDDEFRDLAKEEAEVRHTTLPVHNPMLEMVIGMEWPTVDAYRAFFKFTYANQNVKKLGPTSLRRLKAKEWEEVGLVLVPRAQTHIDKIIKCYGQYQDLFLQLGSMAKDGE